jgi:hypothetical protein
MLALYADTELSQATYATSQPEVRQGAAILLLALHGEAAALLVVRHTGI